MAERDRRSVYWPAVLTVSLGLGIVVNAFFWGYFAIFILPVAVAIILIGAVGAFTRPRRLIQGANVFAGLVIVASVVNLLAFVGVERQVSWEARWQPVDPAEAGRPDCVRFALKEWPNRVELVCSEATVAHLDAKPDDEPASLSFEVVYDWREVRGYSLEAIDGRAICDKGACAEGELEASWQGGGVFERPGVEPRPGSPFEWGREGRKR